METSALFFFFFFSSSSLLLTPISSSQPTCSPSSCSPLEPRIRFPFRLKTNPNKRCGYPGFDLSCNNRNQTILTLPNTDPFIVKYIDYADQSIYVNDPDYCLPKRLLNLTFSGSLFLPLHTNDFTFLNCSSEYWSHNAMDGSRPIYCLTTNHNFTVVATPAYYQVPYMCQVIKTVSVPIQDLFFRYGISMDLTEDLQLRWSVPGCGKCEAQGGTCGFGEGDTIGCLNHPSRGLPRSAKYGIIIGAGIPGLVCLIGLLCYTGSKIRSYGTRTRHLDIELSNPTITPQWGVVMMGLDRPTIESYSKTVLGESRRLPKPNDATCPICLAEYQPKETLRTIPECNHYFHAACIDEWLTMNATCPMCRNTLEWSSVVTPCSSTVSFSSSS